MSVSASLRRFVPGLFLLLSAAEASARHTTIIYNTPTECFNEQGERIKCPFKMSSFIIGMICLGSVILFLVIIFVVYCWQDRKKRRSGRGVITSPSTTRRAWRWPWARKYQKVSDPEETHPAYEPEYLTPDYVPPAMRDPYLHGEVASEKTYPVRTSSDTFYVPPQLGYEYKASEASGSKSPYTHSANSSVVEIPPPLPPVYQAPSYPPPRNVY